MSYEIKRKENCPGKRCSPPPESVCGVVVGLALFLSGLFADFLWHFAGLSRTIVFVS
ncbi:hypothetical protein [Desulfogranum mediterraneum]|uniref:hypothetical protein n=1 Tax=Desulfogranum mediterraneum TaxID=160661 RepID=UPI000417DCB5|nr:hypothetical protein [Desulfogranum mediterraneum]